MSANVGHNIDQLSDGLRKATWTLGAIGTLYSMVWPPTRKAWKWLWGWLGPYFTLPLILAANQDRDAKRDAKLDTILNRFHINTYMTRQGLDRLIAFSADPQGRCIWSSSGWCRITGMSSDESTSDDGAGWLMAVHPDDREKAWADWTRGVASHRRFELRYRYKSGQSVVITATPLKNDRGELLEIYGEGVLDQASEAERLRRRIGTDGK